MELLALDGADTDTVSSTFFVDAGTGNNLTANLGLFNPDNFIEDGLDPRLITTCFIVGSAAGSNEEGIVSVLHSASGQNPAITVDSEIQDVGAVYGLAYNKETEAIFAGAFQKRSSDVGTGANGNDNGNGVIYRISDVADANGGNNSVNKFIDLDEYYNQYFSETGAYAHGDSANGDSASNRGSIDFATDIDSFNAVTKVGLGDVEISEDRQHIWTINLADLRSCQSRLADCGALGYQ